MIRVTSQSPDYAPERVRARYVSYRASEGEFFFVEVGDDRRYDIRQGYVDAQDLPPDIRQAASDRAGFWPPYVEWPL